VCQADTVPAQSFCAEISFSIESFRLLVRVAFLRLAQAQALIYTKENNDF
jgi:hypothetical protein